MSEHGSNSAPISPEDLALYAMQALSAEEMAAVATALRDNPQARQELAQIQGDLALLALSSNQQAVPAGSYDRLKARMQQSAASPLAPSGPAAAAGSAVAPVPAPIAEMRRRSKWATFTPWAIAAALAIACSMLGYRTSALNDAVDDETRLVANLAAKASRAQQVLEVLNAPNAQRVTLTSAKTPPVPTAHTVYLAERGALVMEASNLKPVPSGKAYELWVIPANGSAPVAAGTFAPDAQGYASLVLPTLAPGITAKAFGITVENAGGSRAPTSPIVLSGE
jgi:anti-sigma-K factor RskA